MENIKRGYCQLEIGGKKRTLHFSMNSWAVWEEVSGYTISQIDQVLSRGLSISVLRAFIYSGLVANDQESGNEVDYTVFDVGSWMGDLPPNDLELVTKAILESRVLGQDLNGGLRRNVTKSSKSPK